MKPEERMLHTETRWPGRPYFGATRTNTGVRRCLLASVAILAVACSANADNAIDVSLDEPFQLRIRQTARVESEGIELGLLSVSGDSRCPKNETCVWEGDATVRISLRIGGGSTDQFELHTNAGMASTAVLKGFSVRLVSLHPEVLGGAAIEPEKYIATFLVSRGVAGGQLVY